MRNATHNDGGPAFPWRYMDRDSMGQEVTREQGEGMTLRDYFAGQALVGTVLSHLSQGGITYDSTARDAYRYADAMLAAREKGAK
jgi:hypothetical protein